MVDHCTAQGCPETAAVVLEEHPVCQKHFLSSAYSRLETISTQIQRPEFHKVEADGAAGFLEECMRLAAEIACFATAPGNLERAQVLDVMLWASELHGRLRRGGRFPAKVPILLRSTSEDRPWELAHSESRGIP